MCGGAVGYQSLPVIVGGRAFEGGGVQQQGEPVQWDTLLRRQQAAQLRGQV